MELKFVRKTRGYQIETVITLAAALAVTFFTPTNHPFAAFAAEQNAANEAELQKCSKLVEEKHYKEAYQGFKPAYQDNAA